MYEDDDLEELKKVNKKQMDLIDELTFKNKELKNELAFQKSINSNYELNLNSLEKQYMSLNSNYEKILEELLRIKSYTNLEKKIKNGVIKI